jgi:hypothetical protein
MRMSRLHPGCQKCPCFRTYHERVGPVEYHSIHCIVTVCVKEYPKFNDKPNQLQRDDPKWDEYK